jgi:hypothetical protein
MPRATKTEKAPKTDKATKATSKATKAPSKKRAVPGKEAKAPAKEKKSSVSPKRKPRSGVRRVVARKPKPVTVSREDIALRAYFIAERRQSMGWPGDETSDWVEAERQICQEAGEAAGKGTR